LNLKRRGEKQRGNNRCKGGPETRIPDDFHNATASAPPDAEPEAPSAAEIADLMADADTSDGVFGEPFTGNLNLRHLLATNQIEKLQLHRYMSADEAAKHKNEYPDASLVHHTVTQDTVGFDGDRVAFIHLTPPTAGITESELCSAESGLSQLDWYNTDNSHRPALRDSGGFEIQFGHIEQGAGVHTFTPTHKQRDQYQDIWPLIHRMNGIFARVSPRMFRNQLLDQQSTDFSLSATDTSTISTITALRNAPSASHVDGNNAEAGMVTMTTCGNFTGGDFVFLEFGIALPMPPGSILIAATHRYWHGNLRNVRGLRYSILGYFREGLRGKTAPQVKVNGPDLPFTKHSGGGTT